MKRITKLLQMFCVLAVFAGSKNMQSQCAINFNYTVNPNGNVSFSATPTGTFNQLYWVFGNGSTFSSFQPTLSLQASTNYTAGGNYIVTLYAIGSCSATSGQTVNVSIFSGSCNLNAGFTPQVSNNGYVSFLNTSTGTVIGATSYSMNYGDGSSATGMTPGTGLYAHTYTANGVYTAMLTANVSMTSACTSSSIATFSVNTICTTPITPNFSYTQAAGNVTVTSTSTGTNGGSTYDWSFYGGSSSPSTVSSSSPQAVYTYSTNGTFGIMLSVYNAAPSCTATSNQTITVNSSTVCNVVANFGSTQYPNSVSQFYSSSTNAAPGATYAWDFGDGTNGTGASPTHTYAADGVYTVVMTVDNNFTPACVSTKTLNVTVNSGCALAATISRTVTSNGNVNFVNSSIGTNTSTTVSWDFGDGTTGTGNFVSHTYLNGTYMVTLTVANPGFTPACVSINTTVVTVTTNPCSANSGFSMVPSGTPQDWYAVVSSTTGVTGALWSWGDGSTSNTLISSHSYSAAGNYSICLTVTVSCGATSTSCYTYNISKSTAGGIIHVQAISQEEALATSINNASANTIGYSISPNPSNGNFKLNISGLNSSKAKINIYNVVGSLVYEGENEVSNGTFIKDINLETISGGVYFIKINANNKEYTKKLIINK